MALRRTSQQFWTASPAPGRRLCHGGLALCAAILLAGCATRLPLPPRRVAVAPLHRGAHHRHHHRPTPRPSPPPALVQLNQPLIRSLERSVMPWESPHFTDIRLAFPAALVTAAGTDAGSGAAESVPTIVVHPHRHTLRTSANTGEAVP